MVDMVSGSSVKDQSRVSNLRDRKAFTTKQSFKPGNIASWNEFKTSFKSQVDATSIYPKQFLIY